ncbi:unnamed protein product, partial [Prorocentrum cordatum]
PSKARSGVRSQAAVVPPCRRVQAVDTGPLVDDLLPPPHAEAAGFCKAWTSTSADSSSATLLTAVTLTFKNLHCLGEAATPGRSSCERSRKGYRRCSIEPPRMCVLLRGAVVRDLLNLRLLAVPSTPTTDLQPHTGRSQRENLDRDMSTIFKPRTQIAADGR